ncbi:glycosyltransferase family 2 protein [Cyclobacterium xiamenense]|uniref:glycosyltransferase family 2 protein n=1 Tax=Cyclobacterium xiamenense TaxID=1297121 RepID=UPI0035CEBA9E
MGGKELSLSIIIPMYNVAPYVERCLRSLANQDIPNEEYEIICVNDGSPDRCREIVEELQREISNIVLLDQENQGVSVARNKAMARARGRYLLPIDPDDYLVPNCLKQALEQADRNSLDVLYCAFEIFDNHDRPIWRTDYAHLNRRIDNGCRGYFAVRGPKVKDPDRSWAILYKAELLRKFQIDYPRKVPYLEDGLFLGKVFSVASRVGYSDADFYQRTTRPGSATNSKLFYTEQAATGFLNALQDLASHRSNFIREVSAKRLLNHIKAKFLFLLLIPLIHAGKKKQYLQVIDLIRLKQDHELSIDGVSGYYRFIGSLYKMSPILFWYLYKPVSKLGKMIY